ncbi:MAG: RHS repeat-associated core domain-containing protein [Leptothrix ochracea]|uniref:RHS repeat-associated core domain-containing protein n=1 Tax=Leptothrix ochracea TaxID=735331 RepID=UPI0034E2EEB3
MTTTFTHGIRLEVAQDVLGALLAHWSEAAAQAQDAANPDLGRLASVRNTAGVTNFLYNGLEQRVAKSGPLGTFFYAYDEAGHVLGEYDSTGAPLYEVIWLGDTPVGVLRTTFSAATSTYAATTDTVFVDHLNTPRTISNPNGGLLWTWAPYEDPYAQIVPPSAATGYVFNLRMPGQIFDKETGLFHNGHRDYNPATGRYIQPDPIGLEGGINRYGYVGGNPVMWSDPDGLSKVQGQASIGGSDSAVSGVTKSSTAAEVEAAIKRAQAVVDDPKASPARKIFLKGWIKVAKRGFTKSVCLPFIEDMVKGTSCEMCVRGDPISCQICRDMSDDD